MNVIQKYSNLLVIVFLLFLGSCSVNLHLAEVKHHSYEISDSISAEEEMEAFLLPYREALQEEMQEVVGYAVENMPRSQPESLLGNFVADLILEQGQEYYGSHIDISVVNIGGLRVPNLPQGEINKGNVFELMPFDNYLVVMKLNGETIKQIANVIGEYGGWPVSGMSFILNKNIPEQIIIGEKPLDLGREYLVVLSDFLADGGDRLSFLVDLPRHNLGILFRDAIFDYLEKLRENNLQIHSKLDGRLQYAE